jgi:hypothetical protein
MMTNPAPAFPAMPAAAEVHCVAPRWCDYVRIAWWMVKGMRLLPVANCILPVLMIAAAVLTAQMALSWPESSSFALLLIPVGPLAVLGAMICGYVVLLTITSARAHRRFYMDPERKAVLLLIERPGVGTDSGEWKIHAHTVAKTGHGYGAKLRERLVPPAQAIAGLSNIVIRGQAANKKVLGGELSCRGDFGQRN